MPRSVTIGNRTFDYPDAGDPAGWGKEATDAFEALVEQVGNVLGPNDIPKTQANLSNNASGNIVGMFFDPVTVRGATVNYTVYRPTASTDLCETGAISVRFVVDGATDEKFNISQISNGDAGITISVGDAGQFTYVTTDEGAAATGIIFFSGKAFEV